MNTPASGRAIWLPARDLARARTSKRSRQVAQLPRSPRLHRLAIRADELAGLRPVRRPRVPGALTLGADGVALRPTGRPGLLHLRAFLLVRRHFFEHLSFR